MDPGKSQPPRKSLIFHGFLSLTSARQKNCNTEQKKENKKAHPSEKVW